MPTLNKEPEQNVIPEQPKEKKQRIEEASISEIWIQCSGIILSQSDRNDLCDGEWLNDNHVNFAQSILKRQFPHIDGWWNTLLLNKEQKKINCGIQRIYTRRSNWIVSSTLGCNGRNIQIYDSLYTSEPETTQTTILNLLETNGTPNLVMSEVTKQEGLSDCGVFAIATATALAFGRRPVHFKPSTM
jgi:Ulp1 family protease